MFQNLLFACALTSTLGLASIKEDIKPSYKVDEVSFHLDTKKMVSYDNVNHSIVLELSEVNYQYDYLAEYYSSALSGFNTITYNGSDFDFEENDGEAVYFSGSSTYGFYFFYSGVDSGKFVYRNGDTDLPFEYGFTLYVTTESYVAFKECFEIDIQANSASDDMPQVLDDFVGVLTTAIGSLASGIAGGVTAMAQDLFLQEDAEGHITGLSVFGGIIALFAGLALAVAITTKVYTWVTTLGN